ncbi:MAG: molybdopterin-dependent oxidoreductase [Desulfobacterales bacterium]|nr:molybdopterin-dependent oxidoreductase [Desulfobacterales bacterium]
MQKEDVWIHTICDTCLAFCGMLVNRVDGVIVNIKGDPDCPNSRGKLCSRGIGSIMALYDPNRIRTPLKRTNPEKGIRVDPGWVPISWEEALDILEEKLDKVRKEDPRKLTMSHFDHGSQGVITPWLTAFGTPNRSFHGYFCGNHLHTAIFLTTGTFHVDFDTEYCDYLILFGHQMGFGAGVNTNITTQNVAAARKRGMKVISVDPICNNAGAKADQWLPIRPGTDAALILSMINVLLNERGLYDREFIKKHTNGPYLVRPDGRYARMDGKPLVWDAAQNSARPYDQDVSDYAIEGSYTVDGQSCRPAFSLLREHVKKYTPEMAAGITTIPAATIRRVAGEFGTAARIGSTIRIDGQDFPHRPVTATLRRGAGAHEHGVAVSLSIQLLNMVVGAFYVPGAHRGTNIVGPSWSWAPREVDGIIKTAPILDMGTEFYEFKADTPQAQTLDELFPLTTNRSGATLSTLLEPEPYRLPYQPEVLFLCRRNHFLGGINQKTTAQALKAYKFIAYFSILLDENADFADLVLPEATFLEKLQILPQSLSGSNTAQSGYWFWGIRQPVSPPVNGARDWADVLLELAERLGFLGDIYKILNRLTNDHGIKDPYKLDPSRKYSNEDIADRKLKTKFGEEMGLDWFRQNGYLKIKRKVDEQYPLPWLKVRFPIYFENFLVAKQTVAQVAQNMGLQNWDLSDYDPLPEWKPCAAFQDGGEFDLTAVNFRVPTHSHSFTAQNAWLAEVAEMNPYAQKILLNAATAAQKGIKDKDRIVVTSCAGEVSGEVKVTECIHPGTVGMSSHFGSLAKGKPIACGKGANLHSLLPYKMDPVSTGMDACVKVKVRKA